MPPSGPVHYGPPQVHQASNLPQGTPSIDHVVDSRLNESLTTTSVTSNWTGLGSNMLPMAITGLTYDVQPTLSASTNETPNLDSNQSIDFDTDIDPFANQDYFTPRDSQQDYLGDYTFSWH